VALLVIFISCIEWLGFGYPKEIFLLSLLMKVMSIEQDHKKDVKKALGFGKDSPEMTMSLVSYGLDKKAKLSTVYQHFLVCLTEKYS
jgi:hypothetical protein